MQNENHKPTRIKHKETKTQSNHGTDWERCRKLMEEHAAKYPGASMPRLLPIVEYDGKKWFFDERLRQIRNIEDPYDYKDLNKEEMFIFKHQCLLKEICKCTDSSVAEGDP